MTKKYEMDKLKEKLAEHGCSVKILYQWIKIDHISCSQFEELLEWIPQWRAEQVLLDSFD